MYLVFIATHVFNLSHMKRHYVSKEKKDIKARADIRGVLTLTWYTYMCLPFGVLFREIWYSDRWVSSEMKEPKNKNYILSKLLQKTPNLGKIMCFSIKKVYRWVSNWAQNWYRESQIFKVRQAHPRTILAKVPPPG